MISVSEKVINMLGQPARQIKARVELYECSILANDDYNRTLLNVFRSSDALQEFKVERIADDGKFFGFGVCQKLTVKLRDKDRAINIDRGQVLEVSFGVEEDYTYPCPLFRVEEVSRDETTNNLTIIAYDFLYKAGEHRVSELNLTSYTIRNFVYAAAHILNLPVKFDIDEDAFDLSFPTGANFEGTETLREALNAVADATQTIFFVDWDWRLTFKRLDQYATPALTIDKSKYFELKNKTDRTLTTICHATELGDNIEATTGNPGVVQYIRNNPFWDLREDVDVLLSNALAAIAGITISQFDCSWRGNFALEIGDKINITTKDNGVLVGYVLNDTITYNGGLKEQTSWTFTEHTAETAANPINLGEALKQTYARVDKANKTITLLASETNARLEEVRQDGEEYADAQRDAAIKVINDKAAEIKITTDGITNRVSNTETRLNGVDGSLISVNESISSIEQTANNISAQVSSVETLTNNNKQALEDALGDLDQKIKDQLGDIDGELITIKSSVDTKLTSEDLTIEINKVVEAGAKKVQTSTGYKFDDDGLTVSKTGSEMETTITDDGMTVYRSGAAVLVANNEGVAAEDLHATTYLIVGANSRFEDYNYNRTGCFWIGG